MPDTLYPLTIRQLVTQALFSLKQGHLFGIYKSLFFNPADKPQLQSSVFNQKLETPIGLAAGPHTQMAQNIVAGWLCGARYIELKTVQTLDEITVSKPCIDIADEGYNCEWSQELKIRQSYEEYLKAWILIHILRHELKFPPEFSTVFNMSVGYDMNGILQDNVQEFFSKMRDCFHEKNDMIRAIRDIYPAIDDIAIPDRISDNITLSTMHGCPPDEIGKIGHYLLTEKKLHTFIKLNPTLLGKNNITAILNDLGYETLVPDAAFEHDIRFDDACSLIGRLQKTADKEKRFFGIKLTNTLESVNHKDVFSDEFMYMSGKALHPVSINVAHKVRKVFPDLKISFCGGVNAGNVSDVLACGLSPVTVCSDILLPGGYTRLLQYLEQIDPAARTKEPATFLAAYADKVRQDKTYGHRAKSIKTPKPLNEFDCISAPCTGTCPTRQSIPAYLYFTARGENEAALRVILEDNPFPASTGMICDHSCQTACTRINYDEAIRIRDVKRYVAENSGPVRPKISGQYRKLRVSVIGAGPSGLSCAYYLALAGCTVEVFETKNVAGGMLADAIPEFRLSPEALERDIAAIEKTGVRIHKNTRISKESFGQLRGTSDYIYIAAGAQDAVKADIPGCENAAGLLDPLKFLSEIRKRNIPDLGKNIVILGGGNTAIDAARTARRIADPDSTVSIVYRRTRKEMPADPDEIDDALEENIRLIELTAPARVITEKGKVKELECHAMRLEKDGTNARPRPVVLPGRDFTIPADTLIPAFGQQLAVDFVDEALLKPRSGMETQIENVFIGGDAYRGASFLIRAIADGKTVAQEMLARAGAEPSAARESRVPSTREEHHVALSRVVPGIPPRMLDAADRTLDHPAELPLSREEAISEARRCLNCDEICDICISVCPNRANAGYTVEPLTLPLEKVIVSRGSYDAVPDKSFVLEQASQVLNLADLCNECGNCTTFCPSAGRPFADKPRIALSKESFDSLETGYFAGDGYILYKHSGTLYRLDTKKTGSRFSTGNIKIDLDDQFHILNVTFDKSDNAEVSLRPAVSMRIINDAIAQIRQPRNY